MTRLRWDRIVSLIVFPAACWTILILALAK